MHRKRLAGYALGLLSVIVGLVASHEALDLFAKTGGASTAAPQGAAGTVGTAAYGPPWRYGRADARITVIEYADLECPYCRSYFTVLRRWVDEHADVNWEWRHLPLSMHEPAAVDEARLAECVGQTQGPTAFWDALGWVYIHTRGDGQGLPKDLRYPALTPATQRCLDSDTGESVRAQAAAAHQEGIAGTPTLRLVDNTSGRTLLLPGPVEGDALLSAIDLLVANQAGVTPSSASARD